MWLDGLVKYVCGLVFARVIQLTDGMNQHKMWQWLHDFVLKECTPSRMIAQPTAVSSGDDCMELPFLEAVFLRISNAGWAQLNA